MIYTALIFYGLALLPLAAAVAWCDWIERHETARNQWERERAYREAADQLAEHTYRQHIRRHVNQPLTRKDGLR